MASHQSSSLCGRTSKTRHRAATAALGTVAALFVAASPASGYGFKPPLNYPAHDGPAGIAVGSLNGDAVPDLVVANYQSDDVSVLLGNADGSFQAPVSYGVGSAPSAIAVRDVTGDSRADVVTTNEGSDDVSVLAGSGDGTFQPEV